MSNVFDLYEKVKPHYEKAFPTLTILARNEFKEIAHIKTTDMNKNYMFNDKISSKFYDALGFQKNTLAALISQYVKSTNNFDSLDANNIMLQFLMRYALQKGNSVVMRYAFEIFTYKIYYPVWNIYFKYGIDIPSFEYFKTTLNSKFYLARVNTIYDAVDAIANKYLETYEKIITSKDEQEFLRMPVNMKTRLNQFVKQIMSEYTEYLKTNKVHLNAAIEIDNEGDEEGVFSTQSTNNNQQDVEYKNRLSHALMHTDLEHSALQQQATAFKKSTLKDVEMIYHKILKNYYYNEFLSSLFIDYRTKTVDIKSSKTILDWIINCKKNNITPEIAMLDKVIFEEIPEYKSLTKTELAEKRCITVILLYRFLLKALR